MKIGVIGDYFEIKGGKRLPKGETLVANKTKHPYIRITDFDGHKINLNGIEYLESHIQTKIKRYTVDADDLIISIVGTTGLVALVPKELNKANLTENCAKLIPVDNNIDRIYLYYYLSSNIGQRIIQSFVVGSTQPKLPLYGVSDIFFPLKPLVEQIEIGRTLYSLDQKITLLHQQNQTLEELAQTLFKRWFVEFEFPCLPSGYRPLGQVNLGEMAKVCTYSRVGGAPAPDGQSWFVYVLLCEDGSFYKGMTNDLYRRFYEHYTGEGAKHTKIHKPVKIIYWEQFNTQDEARAREEELKKGFGRTWLQREYDKLQKYGHTTSDGLPAHQTKLVPAGKMVESELGEIPEGWRVGLLSEILEIKYGKDHKHLDNGDYPVYGSGGVMRYVNDYLYNKPSILLPRKGTLSNIFYLEEPFWSVDTMFYSKIKKVEYGKYCFQLLKRVNLSLLDVGSAVPSLSTSVLNEMDVLIPPFEIVNDFEETLTPLYHKNNSNKNEIQTLTQLRDTLLPKLMSGEVRVKDEK